MMGTNMELPYHPPLHHQMQAPVMNGGLQVPQVLQMHSVNISKKIEPSFPSLSFANAKLALRKREGNSEFDYACHSIICISIVKHVSQIKVEYYPFTHTQ